MTDASFDLRMRDALIEAERRFSARREGRRFSPAYFDDFKREWCVQDTALTGLVSLQQAFELARRLGATRWKEWRGPSERELCLWHHTALSSPGGGISLELLLLASEDESLQAPTESPAWAFHVRVHRALRDAETYFQRVRGLRYATHYFGNFYGTWLCHDPLGTGSLPLAGVLGVADALYHRFGWRDWAGPPEREVRLWTEATQNGERISVEDVLVANENPSLPTWGRGEAPAAGLPPTAASAEAAAEPAGLPDAWACVVCFAAPRSCVFLPCKHLTMCKDCAADPKLDRRRCVVCRTVSTELMHLFL